MANNTLSGAKAKSLAAPAKTTLAASATKTASAAVATAAPATFTVPARPANRPTTGGFRVTGRGLPFVDGDADSERAVAGDVGRRVTPRGGGCA